MTNEPMTAQKLDCPGSVVLNSYEIREDELALKSVGLPVHKYRPDRDADSLGDGDVGHHDVVLKVLPKLLNLK